MHLNRRTFVSTLASSPYWLSTASSRAEEPVQADHWTLGFSTYGAQKMKLEAAMEAIGNQGYDSIEICVSPDWQTAPDQLNRQRRTALRNRMQESDLQLTSLMLHLNPSSSVQRHAQDLQLLRGTCELVHDLTVDRLPPIQTVLGGKHWVEDRNRLVERVGDWVEIAQDSDAVIAIKPHRGHALSLPEHAAWLMHQLDNPNCLRMYFDYSHFMFRDLSMEKLVDESIPMTSGIAVKDAIETDGKVNFLLPGEVESIPFDKLFRLLYDGGFRGDVCVEVSSQLSRMPDYDPIMAMKTSYLGMDRAFQKAKIARPQK